MLLVICNFTCKVICEFQVSPYYLTSAEQVPWQIDSKFYIKNWRGCGGDC